MLPVPAACPQLEPATVTLPALRGTRSFRQVGADRSLLR